MFETPKSTTLSLLDVAVVGEIAEAVSLILRPIDPCVIEISPPIEAFTTPVPIITLPLKAAVVPVSEPDKVTLFKNGIFAIYILYLINY
jgi:hypothetical protein